MKKKMTKLLALALAATFALTACNTGGETTEPAPSEDGETAETTTSEGEGIAEATSETAEHEPITDLYMSQTVINEMETFNMLYSQSQKEFDVLCNNWDGLLEVDTHGVPIAGIAEDWGSDEADRDGEVTLNIPEEHFFPWSPDTPFLYDLTVGTMQGGEEQFDTVHSYFALRKWSCEPDARGVLRFCLNGKSILLNGLLDQGYWPQGLYTPPSDAAVERELSEVKALGFNLLRKHAKIEPQRWYYHCDRLGLVVWQDMVNGGGRYNLWFVTYLTNVLQPLVRRLPDAEPLWGLLSRGKASSRETYRKELQATVEALRCHPCIGCWVPFNEGWGQFDAAGAVQAIRTLDDTRLVDEASGWYDQGGGDVCSIHNYFYPLHVKPGSRTVALSEYGGIAWPMPGHEAPGKTYGYGTAKSRADLTARCKKLQLGTVLPQLKKGLSALVYTQLTDVEDEVNGLFTYDRAEIKPDANAVRSVNAALAAEFAKVTR